MSPAEQRAWIAARLDPLDRALAAPPIRSDYDLNPDAAPAGEVALRPAAVLVPLVEREHGLNILLTRRADTLRSHTGQVAFPGGRLDPGETPWQAALREAQEEIALDPAFVTVAGLSTAYRTVTHYHVTPVVGFLRPGFSVAPSEAEVAEIFEIPFDAVMRPDSFERRFFDLPSGARRWFYGMDYDGRLIWGATAGMLRALHDRLAGEAAA